VSVRFLCRTSWRRSRRAGRRWRYREALWRQWI